MNEVDPARGGLVKRTRAAVAPVFSDDATPSERTRAGLLGTGLLAGVLTGGIGAGEAVASLTAHSATMSAALDPAAQQAWMVAPKAAIWPIGIALFTGTLSSPRERAGLRRVAGAVAIAGAAAALATGTAAVASGALSLADLHTVHLMGQIAGDAAGVAAGAAVLNRVSALGQKRAPKAPRPPSLGE